MEHIFAQTLKIGGGDQTYTIDSGFTGLPTTISEIVKKAFPFIFALAGVGLLLMIIAAGFTLMTSAGDAKKMESGKNRLTFAIVGFLVIFTAFWVVQLFGIMFGVEPIQKLF
ncbi:MAG: hypothetical protein UW37_C0007G0024 [Candidatus Gottesmanbacteria bacterium GW2011_GWA2_44_17]|uniref:Uncharacterized protein n=3 Tax=Candidatus Gottesmaniibacteriota TaxID=1752720 RepID=A0A0G1IPF4_9BACT|nr:MAG: hypothetical protein UV63_C0019G0015 [Microgenomates group bacterium GW2011_GWC1_43_11]KKT38889.1 MAG: hypothetical protein UW22_C0004G0019 [Candidatus Gottesmanbacteria bacterium GW2011_GWB1_44_11c]KKT47458.1 MAG: hypothetical protein UW37_C0007G0024 [Candidatus Gottesmanbacteria bacterium GW2011_GWA2_44_17]KKT61251.1 MAG: hypothetical protein UW52_C0007G0018 [Candidatus Gottesmanbacteria bacterium GW2011_GWA1_44_24b]HCM82471.1 hypothetical protein [Patescibacteria group bacterium]